MVWKESRGPENRPKRELADLRWRAEEREEKGGGRPRGWPEIENCPQPITILETG